MSGVACREMLMLRAFALISTRVADGPLNDSSRAACLFLESPVRPGTGGVDADGSGPTNVLLASPVVEKMDTSPMKGAVLHGVEFIFVATNVIFCSGRRVTSHSA